MNLFTSFYFINSIKFNIGSYICRNTSWRNHIKIVKIVVCRIENHPMLGKATPVHPTTDYKLKINSDISFTKSSATGNFELEYAA
jgi:hypothetical protein